MKRIATLVQDGKVVGFACGPDAIDQRITIDGKEWRFDFDEMSGPLWLRKDGMPRERQNPNKKVWLAFEEWFQVYQQSK